MIHEGNTKIHEGNTKIHEGDTKIHEGLRRSTRIAALDTSPDEFRVLGHRLVDQIAEHMARMPDGLVKRDETATAVRKALGAERRLPDDGTAADELLTNTANLLFDHSVFNGHPRFLGYITSSPAPIGVLGDLLASAVNQNVGNWGLAPMATEIEMQTVRWIAEFIGYSRPASGPAEAPGAKAGGLLVSGGNMANLACFLAARTAKAGLEIRKTGVAATAPRLLAYASCETHTWLQKAADLTGLGTDAIRWIPVDAHQRMDTAELRRQIAADRAAGHQPFIVVGNAGTVSTGAVDPLREIGGICRELDVWFHVDGAYGALAAAIPDAPEDLCALAEADSVAVDPHKWLYAPLEAGCALVRRAEDLRNAFSYRPPYYRFNEEMVHLVDYGPQNSRGFRALKVWLALQHIGRRGYIHSIAEDMRLSRKLYQLLDAHPRFEALTQNLSITTFRYVPAGKIGSDPINDLDRVNQELLSRVDKSGEAFLSNAYVDGKFALRACIVNFRTSDEDVEALPGIMERMASTI